MRVPSRDDNPRARQRHERDERLRFGLDESGRNPFPFTQVPEWIYVSGATPQAQALYVQLSMHLNSSRGDRYVWPSRKSLAKRLGFSRPQSVDRYLDELVTLGALVIESSFREDRGQDSNSYLLREIPPEGYTGPRSLREWTRKHDEDTDDPLCATAHTPCAPQRTPPVRHSAHPPVRHSAHKPDEEKPHEENHSSSYAQPSQPPQEPREPAEEEGSHPGNDNGDECQGVSAVAAAIVDQAVSEWKGHRRPTRSERARLAERAAAALAKGSTPEGVHWALTRNLGRDEVRKSAVQVVMSRTACRGWADEQPPAPAPTSAAPPKCPSCNPFRRLEGPEGKDLGPCPTCHPSIAQTAEAS